MPEETHREILARLLAKKPGRGRSTARKARDKSPFNEGEITQPKQTRRARKKAEQRFCTTEGCGGDFYARGLCHNCYKKARWHGALLPKEMEASDG